LVAAQKLFCLGQTLHVRDEGARADHRRLVASTEMAMTPHQLKRAKYREPWLPSPEEK
jgi:hypothetical protein